MYYFFLLLTVFFLCILFECFFLLSSIFFWRERHTQSSEGLSAHFDLPNLLARIDHPRHSSSPVQS